MVEIRPLTYKQVGKLYDLRTTPEQERFVAPNGITMGQSPFEPASEVFGIWDGDTPLGLIAIVDMAHPDADVDEDDDRDGIYVWRLMIGADAQRQGLGTRAMRFAIDMARQRGRAHVAVCCVDEPGSAIAFYEKLGFRKTGKILGDEEHEMVLYF